MSGVVGSNKLVESMIIKRFKEQDEIVALDDTRVREFLNPKHDKSDLHLTYSLAHASIAPGKSSLPHRFLEASEVYYILRGKGFRLYWGMGNDLHRRIGLGPMIIRGHFVLDGIHIMVFLCAGIGDR